MLMRGIATKIIVLDFLFNYRIGCLNQTSTLYC